jgi:hypothetical protein
MHMGNVGVGVGANGYGHVNMSVNPNAVWQGRPYPHPHAQVYHPHPHAHDHHTQAHTQAPPGTYPHTHSHAADPNASLAPPPLATERGGYWQKPYTMTAYANPEYPAEGAESTPTGTGATPTPAEDAVPSFE